MGPLAPVVHFSEFPSAPLAPVVHFSQFPWLPWGPPGAGCPFLSIPVDPQEFHMFPSGIIDFFDTKWGCPFVHLDCQMDKFTTPLGVEEINDS